MNHFVGNIDETKKNRCVSVKTQRIFDDYEKESRKTYVNVACAVNF